jgi:NADPH-dependent 7-cyano-7-deazaguanine reductase QueF-like protein
LDRKKITIQINNYRRNIIESKTNFLYINEKEKTVFYDYAEEKHDVYSANTDINEKISVPWHSDITNY